MTKHFDFTSESVSEGHPDKVCDQISDAVVDYLLKRDPQHSHIACESLATTNYVLLAGEISSSAAVTEDEYRDIARRVITRIGYTSPDIGFSAADAQIDVRIHSQSADIAKGVNNATDDNLNQGAGDQGMMFGFACDETPELMPAPLFYAHRLVEHLAKLRHEGKVDFLRPDAKSQVTVEYDGDWHPVAVKDLVIAQQHTPGALSKVREFVRKIIPDVIPADLLRNFAFDDSCCHINGCDDFETGGPNGDCGLTGRKIIVDTYGGMGRHGGGAFSGKDPSKVDRSACYMARYVAKNLVAAGVARRCEIQVAYAIGLSRPLSFMVNTFGTGKVEDELLVKMLEGGTVFDFHPRAIIESLDLQHPGDSWNYESAASYGHFGRPNFPWEKTDKIAEIRRYLGL